MLRAIRSGAVVEGLRHERMAGCHRGVLASPPHLEQPAYRRRRLQEWIGTPAVLHRCDRGAPAARESTSSAWGAAVMLVPSAFEPYAALSRPTVITDPSYRIVYLNEPAESFWGVAPADAVGHSMERALRLSPPEGRELGEWVRDVLFVALTTGDAFVCRTAPRDGRLRTIQLSGTRFLHDGQWHMAWTVWSEPAAPPAAALPAWALHDPVTALFNRHQWDREFAVRDAAGGAVVLFDIDALKTINDLFGHHTGDAALGETARALAAEVPPGGLVVRFGGDEFAGVLPAHLSGEAEGFAKRVAARAAEHGRLTGLPAPLRLSYGLAPFAPGGLRAALRAADDALYERKGVLLKSAGAGRIVLTAGARGRVLAPGHNERPAPGAFARNFGPEWDQHFRRMFARSVEHAREFVTVAAPEPGSAVIEVGAGSGRITFDGGLAERVGPGGQLLVTDASEAQLQVSRGRAMALGFDWVRFLQATVEELPVASGTVDLVLGSTFLHFTDPLIALSSMARVVRPGGKVAVNASLDMTWGRAWDEILAPVREELANFGLPMRGFLPGREEIEAAVRAAGLSIERVHLAGHERIRFPTLEVALQIVRQISFVSLFLKPVPAERHGPVQEAVEDRLRAAFARGVSDDGIAGGTDTITVVARRLE